MRIQETTARSAVFSGMLAFLVATITTPASSQNQPTPPKPNRLTAASRQDAELRDVAFVDHDCGWAVGDHGAIWSTKDGGVTWAAQESGVSAGLTSICMLSRTFGWIAGGYTEPLTHVSRGIVLKTIDGGTTWTRLDRALLPAILQIQFVDARNGWAIGRNCGLFPHGLFTSEDGGRTWTPLPALGGQPWLCGHFIDPSEGAVAARNGVLADVQQRIVDSPQQQHYGLRSVRDLKINRQGQGVSVGDGGMVLVRDGAKADWKDISARLSGLGGSEFDLRAVAVVGPNIWCAGSPGLRIFHSPDRGQSWQSYATGLPLPLRSLAFADERRGWAVGALGAILTTKDGGQTWQRQRGTQHRVAWLGVYARAADVPLELVASLSARDGYLGTVLLLGRQDFDPQPAADTYRNERENEALIEAGVSGVERDWRFPIRPAALRMPKQHALSLWDRVNQGQGLSKLQERIARQIKTWRPDVILVDSGTRPSDNALSQLICQSVERAAADAATESNRTTSRFAGLDAWNCKRLYERLPSTNFGTIKFTTSSIIPGSGETIGEHILRARGLLTPRYEATPSIVHFKIVRNYTPAGQGRSGFFDGISVAFDSEGRRRPLQNEAIDLGGLRQAADRRRIIQAIVASTARNGQKAKAALAQINRFTHDVDQAAASELLFQLGALFREQGHWDLAAETFAALVESYPNQSLSGAALVWLAQFHSSREAQQVVDGQRRYPVQQASVVRPDTPFGPVVAPEGLAQSAVTHNESTGSANLWTKRLKRSDILLASEPAVRFTEAAALRHSGDQLLANRLYLAIRRSRPRDSWWQCAASELWLARAEDHGGEHHVKPPLRWGMCRAADERPLLDGVLNESFWGGSPSSDKATANEAKSTLPLRSVRGEDKQWPSEVLLAYDREFLYMAVRCRKVAGIDYLPSDKPRTRDADLGDRDRIDFLIDVDRDRVTFFRLTVDHRGWTADSFWESSAWNPQWYVAAAASESEWTCEIAVPLTELVASPPKESDVWCLGIQRTVPGAGFQSWTQPSSPDMLAEGFGYLSFQPMK